ncbi:MAG TPA: hypothetical protein VK324_14765, partial [Tepidisphaeraceae bacterium]|nr:hypothetical protein [Tepidisphaeraceae bacterium]
MSDHQRYVDQLFTRPVNAEQLHAWVKLFGGIDVPRRAVCPHHDAPFDYLAAAFFEPAKDLVVWAPRGGGKTRLGAVATLLDLVHKPGTAVRLLGGSEEQAMRMWEHLAHALTAIDERLVTDRLLAGKPQRRRAALANGSTAAVLAQSETAVRGQRVQKLRCDEVELFDESVWEAAQLVTRSAPAAVADDRGSAAARSRRRAKAKLRPPPPDTAGTVEALSTLHNPYGLMDRVIARARENGVRVVHWCLLDVLERCPPERECGTCPLWAECGGVAKTRCDGFVRVDDAIAHKRRVSGETWEAEVLCRRPNRKGCVFPAFDAAVHVREPQWAVGSGQWAATSRRPHCPPPANHCPLSLAIDFGFANPFVCLWVATSADGVAHVVDEYVQAGRTVAEHVAEIEARPWGRVPRIACDPAGAGRNDQTAESNVQLLKRRGYAVKFRA